MKNKNLVIAALCVAIGIMAVAYAAFSTTLTVNGTLTQIGTFGVQITGCSCTKTAGITGATAPTGSCTPSGQTQSTSATVTAGFVQPGDTVTCTFNVVNTGNLKAKASGDATCTSSASVTTSESTSAAKPFYYTKSWKKTALTKSGTTGATATGDITITMKYSKNISTQPTATSGSVSCTFPYTQDIQ